MSFLAMAINAAEEVAEEREVLRTRANATSETSAVGRLKYHIYLLGSGRDPVAFK
jgi:hypothetical protein